VEARGHFMIGDAYRDIAALAAGQYGEAHANSAFLQTRSGRRPNQGHC